MAGRRKSRPSRRSTGGGRDSAKETSEGLASAVLASTPPVRTRAMGIMVVLRQPEQQPSAAAIRNELGRLGVPTRLVDAAFLRKLDRATSTLLGRVNAGDDALLDRWASDPVASYRSVDPQVADRLTAIHDAARAASVEAPDIGELPATRRPPRAVRPVVRSAAIEEAVVALHTDVVTWAAKDPANIQRLQDDPEGVIEAIAPDAPDAVRRRLLAWLDRPAEAGARKGDRR